MLVPLGQATGTSTTCPSGTGRLGQVVVVPVGQAQFVPTWTGKGQKRPLLVPHGTSHIPMLEAFPCPGTSSIPTMELVPVPLVLTCPTKRVYKAVQRLSHGLVQKGRIYWKRLLQVSVAYSSVIFSCKYPKTWFGLSIRKIRI